MRVYTSIFRSIAYRYSLLTVSIFSCSLALNISVSTLHDCNELLKQSLCPLWHNISRREYPNPFAMRLFSWICLSSPSLRPESDIFCVYWMVRVLLLFIQLLLQPEHFINSILQVAVYLFTLLRELQFLRCQRLLVSLQVLQQLELLLKFFYAELHVPF